MRCHYTLLDDIPLVTAEVERVLSPSLNVQRYTATSHTLLAPSADIIIAPWDGAPALLERIRAGEFNVPVIVIGLDLPVQSIVACIRDGAADYVPLNEIERLPQAIEAVMQPQPPSARPQDQLLSLLIDEVQAVAFHRPLRPDWRFDHLVGGIEQLTGYSDAQFLAGDISFTQLVHTEDRAVEAQRLADVLSVDNQYELVYRIQDRAGELKWICERGRRVSDNEDLLEGVLIDITSIKQIDHALKASLKNFSLIAENSRDIIWMTDRIGRVTYVSPSVERIRGFTVEEEMKLSLDERIAPQSLPRVLDLFSAGLANEAMGNPYIGVDRIEVQQPHKDGRMLWMEMTFTILLDDYGEAIGLMGTSRDITARKQIESALRLSRVALERKVEEVTALYRATTVLFDANNLPDLNAQIRQAVVREFQQGDCGVVLLTDDGQHLHCDGRSGLVSVQPDRRTMPLLGKGLIAQSVRTGKMVYSPDVHEEPNYLGGDDAVLSELVVPLVTPRGVIGALDMQSHQLDAFSEPDLRLIQVFASLAAAAIERMQLYEAVTRQASELEMRVEQRTDELQQIRARTQAILNNVSDSIILTDVNGVIRLVNQSFVRMFGYDRQALIGSNLQDLFVSQLPIRMDFDSLSDYVERGLPQLETQARRRDGTLFDADVALNILDEADTLGIVCSIRDMTERNQAVRALAQSEANLRTIMDNLSLALGLIDSDYRVVAFNARARQSFEHSLGCQPTEGLSLLHSLPESEWREEYIAFLKRVMAGESIILEWQYTDEDGETHWMEANYNPVTAADGQIIGACSYSEDITHRKQAEISLRNLLDRERELNIMKSRFVSMASHDMRTPLTAVLSSSELLMQYWQHFNDEEIPAHVDRHFHKIENSVQHMVALLDDIVVFGEAEDRWRKPQMERCQLDELCTDVIERFRDQYARTGHEIIYESSPDLPALDLDQNLMRRLLNNLLSNAVKYSPDGGEVHLKLTADQDTVHIEVQDHGIGIPADDQPSVFEIFTRGSNVGAILGTGLGLSIAEKVVELHSGTIRCESEEGVGTQIFVTLPIQTT